MPIKPDQRPRIYQTKVSGDTFVSVRLELPAHGHAAQPIREPEEESAEEEEHCHYQGRECHDVASLTSHCGRRRYRHFGVADTIV